ncbi:alpha/beta fold hydrolase [Variovorax sp. Sphag1AA]|uniref:alpha/beta fold hydrolase n=1 Tax=Variovorax sp. Sphag1AA TaxID=2587027 RepID=UPI0017E9E353|nr:alpha/beta hydrolase [Variovorax sp. Sphag1AA]MBB3178134.1 pimeloyl-ACP methyl ester carboxylesterase [Variovorax sp. Sphag1AA]
MKTASAPSRKRATVMLVHGAWLDGSSWMEVIARLQSHGLRVVSIQISLASLGQDVATVIRALEREVNPVVLVGHSWGGTVITQAGASERVAALVYVAGFAPAPCESTLDTLSAYIPLGYSSLLQADSGGYLWFPQRAVPQWFAQDLPLPNAALLAATQRPIHPQALGNKVALAAWRDKPSWYLVTEDDRVIPPALQQSTARRISARTRSVASSHVPFLSRPKETCAIIFAAVSAIDAEAGEAPDPKD